MTDINLNDFEEFMVADFAPLNKPYMLTITGASVGKTYDRKAKGEINVPVLHFRETKKKLKLTSGNNKHTIGRLYGPAASGWIGKQIVVRVNEKEIFGDLKRFWVIDPIAPQAKTEFVVAPAQTAVTATIPSQSEPRAPEWDSLGVKSDVDQMFDVLTFHEIEQPEMVVKRALEHAKGDHAAALAALEEKYGAVPVEV